MPPRVLIPFLVLMASEGLAQEKSVPKSPRWSLAIHGGAGVIERGSLSVEAERAYRTSMLAALDAGAAILRRGGPSLDAVEAAVRVLEDDPLFNAGRGA